MTAATASRRADPAANGAAQEVSWGWVRPRAPQLAATMGCYIEQSALSLEPSSVVRIDLSLRLFAGFLVDTGAEVACVADVTRTHIESYKRWLAARPGRSGTASKNTISQRLGMLRTFFNRIYEWGYTDSPDRNPVFASDLPRLDDPLPRFLDDATNTKLLRAATQAAPFTRLVIETLSRTALRVSELVALEPDAVFSHNGGWWLRVPVGKLHNDRNIPLHPHLKVLLDDWDQARPESSRGRWLIADSPTQLNRHRIVRMLNRTAKAAGIEHVHPHQLRHTLATQAINRGMSLEAVALLLGHRSLRMTLVYARIADSTVAAQYHDVTARVEALYQTATPTTIGSRGSRIAGELQTRMLGNGRCTRPPELDCQFESICEGCSFFSTNIEFRPTLQRQRDDAARQRQLPRQQLFETILTKLDNEAS
jgi:site-specific recombinase XerD